MTGHDDLTLSALSSDQVSRGERKKFNIVFLNADEFLIIRVSLCLIGPFSAALLVLICLFQPRNIIMGFSHKRDPISPRCQPATWAAGPWMSVTRATAGFLTLEGPRLSAFSGSHPALSQVLKSPLFRHHAFSRLCDVIR